MDRLPYTKSVLDSIPGVKESVRYMALYPGAVIKPHRDRGCNYEDGVYRIHIPIQTNDGVEFYVDDQRLFLKEGECWYINFDKVHHIHNRGKEVRVHLVIDGLRTAETDVWFNQQGYREVKKPKYDEATKKAMIAQLELLDTDTARQLIDQLREET